MGNWLTTIKTVDKKPTLVNESPQAYGRLVPEARGPLPQWVFLCPPHGGGVKWVGPRAHVWFEGTDQRLRAVFELEAERGQPGFTEFGADPPSDLECVPMSPEVEASELETAWRRTYRTDGVAALAEARAAQNQVVFYFRGPDCPDCRRVELGTLFWTGIRESYGGDWVLVEPPSSKTQDGKRDDSATLRALFHVTVSPTLIVYDPVLRSEAVRFDGYFSAEDVRKARSRNPVRLGCHDLQYLRP